MQDSPAVMHMNKHIEALCVKTERLKQGNAA